MLRSLHGPPSNVIRDYFLQYDIKNSDFTVDMGTKQIIRHSSFHGEDLWHVTLAETGLETMTGGRVKRVAKYIDEDTFMLTYGDGVGNIDIRSLLRFHREKAAPPP